MRPEDNPQNWHQQKTYDSLMTYGLNAIKFVLVANGGAVLALLTFVGNHTEKTKGLRCTMIWFVLGVFIGGVVNILAYLTQLSLFNQRQAGVSWWQDHRTYLYSAMVLILVGIMCFGAGALEAVFALTV